VHLSDPVAIRRVNQEHPRPDNIGQARAGLAKRGIDDGKASASLVGYICSNLAVRPNRSGRGNRDVLANAHGAAET